MRTAGTTVGKDPEGRWVEMRREFHSKTYSRNTAETRFRARLLLLLFIGGMAPLLSSFLPLKSALPTEPPDAREEQPLRPGSLPQTKPSHEPYQPEYRVARG